MFDIETRRMAEQIERELELRRAAYLARLDIRPSGVPPAGRWLRALHAWWQGRRGAPAAAEAVRATSPLAPDATT